MNAAVDIFFLFFAPFRGQKTKRKKIGVASFSQA
jgi:hypothetical protein